MARCLSGFCLNFFSIEARICLKSRTMQITLGSSSKSSVSRSKWTPQPRDLSTTNGLSVSARKYASDPRSSKGKEGFFHQSSVLVLGIPDYWYN